MDFVIAIPSYQRLNQVENLLKYLDENNVDSENIYIFVDPDCYLNYYSHLGNTKINLIKGIRGLIHQRTFMRYYFDKYQKILYLDDDFKSFKCPPNYKFNLVEEINKMFDRMADNKCFLGSVNPTNNLYFCTGKEKFGLYLCVGCCYLEVNLKYEEFNNLVLDEKEDYTRTLLHYIYSGRVYRNDKICVNHKYSGTSGGMNTSKDRNLMNDLRINVLKIAYGDLIQIFSKKNKKEIRFKQRNFKKITLKTLEKNVVLGEYISNEESNNYKLYGNNNIKFYNNNGELLGVLIKDVIKFRNYKFLDNFLKCKKTTQRGTLGGIIEYDKLPSFIQKCTNKDLDNLEFNKTKTYCLVKNRSRFYIGNEVSSVNFGYQYNKGEVKMSKRNLKYMETFEKHLGFTMKLINNYFLEYAKYKNDNYGLFKTVFNGVTVNKEVRTANHRDTTNYGWGAIINNVMGELHLPEYKITVSISPHDLFIFDSKNIIHSNSENVENRISIVFFQNRFIK